MTGIVQTIDEAASRPIGMSAAPHLNQPFFDPGRHPLIEDKTFALPMLVTELLLVGHDSPAQLINIRKSARAEKRRRFLTTDAARAIHKQGLVF